MAITLVNMIPQPWSDESHQDAEPNLTVNPMNPLELVGTAFTLDTATRTVMVGNQAPIYISTDGGLTWTTNLIVPSYAGFQFPTGDITVRFGGTSGKLYASILKSPFPPPLQVLRTDDPISMTPMTPLLGPAGTPGRDQPYIEAATVLGPVWSPDINKDRIYIAQNQPPSGNAAVVDELLDAATVPPPAPFVSIQLDFRPAPDYDNFQTRFATHQDGTTYGVFYKRKQFPTYGFTGDVVLVRDPSWGLGASPFQAWKDIDGFPGKLIVKRISCPWEFFSDPNFGQERIGGDLAVAVDPRNSQRVYVAYATGTGQADYTLHVIFSTDGGDNWSGDMYPVLKGKNPGLAINSRGVVGLLYQRVVGPAGSSRWETHFVSSTDDFASPSTDTLLANVPADGPNAPVPTWLPYIGDYACLQAVGKNFYGIFSANNYPDQANFLPGVIYQRRVDWSTHQLFPPSGTTPIIPPSIDPFFFKVTGVPPGTDFYVRDWTDTPTSGDNGIEPSSHPDFFEYSDVWNQRRATAYPPDLATDRIIGDPTAYGMGSAGDNYAFARIRRNLSPGGTLPVATVSAHFLVSEFGLGSNFEDAGSPDPSDPDVVITAPDPSVLFALGNAGPHITPSYHWHLNTTSSTHLCLAVEINTTDDPYVQPGLTGHAPGWPSSDLAVIYDNNKAQRNLQVYAGMSAGMFAYYGLAHNASTATRDMVVRYGVTSEVEPHLLEAVVQVIDGKGRVEKRPFKTGDSLTLRSMEPGENRWINVTARLSEAAEAPLPITFYELAGNTVVNGFTITAKPSPLQTVIAENVDFHRTAFGRMAAAFKSAEAQEESDAARNLLTHGGFQLRGCGRWLEWIGRALSFRQTQGGPTSARGKAGKTPPQIPPSAYSRFLQQHVPLVRQAIADLISQQQSGDPFGIEQTIEELARVVKAQELALATPLHSIMLHQLDAFFTMLQKAKGDPADILQTVTWQKELYASLPLVRDKAFVREVMEVSQSFIDRFQARTATKRDYPALIAELLPLFQMTDTLVSGRLRSDIAAIEATKGSVRALQKAHRDYLLDLRQILFG